MDSLRQHGDGIHELAASYAIGALDEAERAAFEEHLRSGCDACARELLDFGEVTDALATASEAEPPRELKSRLMDRIAGAPRAPGLLLNAGGVLISRSEEVNWRPFSPGIQYKPLFLDRKRRYATSLVRMEPGSTLPTHRHPEIEELFLLSGEVHLAGQIMHAGDYCRAEAGSIHGESFTENGCVFLMMASLDNEVIA